MNLSEALDAALPEIPQASLARSRPPRLDPDLIVRDDVLDGEPIVGVFQRDKCNYFRFSPSQWRLIQLFDGVRSYPEIAAEFNKQSGETVSAQDVQVFADQLEEGKFWYKSAQERNIAASQRVMAQRGRRAQRKSKVNLAHISFSAWDPDRYLGWLDGIVGKYIYSPWCALSAVALFIFEASVFISKWSFMGPDMALYYNFTHKGLADFVEFWFLVLVLGFIHESSHGLTCKHYGGQVHQMGFMFIYLAPAFYVDVTEIWISATKLQRLATIIAGIWIEFVICGLAMIVWANTLPGQSIHDFSYQIILLTGVAVVVINLNPLIKLDGYYFMTEVIGIPDLKERSTAFLAGWFQSSILRLPIETIVVPRKRVLLFTAYALLSGAYSYLLLIFVVKLTYNAFSHWLAEFALIPAGLLAFALFRSRLRSLRKVLYEVWEVKLRGSLRLRPVPVIVTASLVVLLFVPLWRDREDAYFVIEPTRSETLHAAVAGRVTEVLVREGEQVRAGQQLLRMTSPMPMSMAESAAAQTHSASFKAFSAELHGESIGPAAAEQNASLRSTRLAADAESRLVVAAPESGIVLSSAPDRLLGQQVGSGQPLLDLACDKPRAVRVYIPNRALERVSAGDEVALELPDRFSPVHLKLAQPGGDAQSLPQGLVAAQEYQGIKLPNFYVARMALPASAGNPRFGEAGAAKIFGVRRSLAGRVYTVVANLVKAHVW
jgi:putative peptide zinc metalloprotease protein